MNEQFQQAVVASRAGQIKEAQFLLAQSLQKDSNNADAWLLLSQLVDSKEKQQAYLAKAIAIEPDHELANEYRAALDEDVKVVAPPVVQKLDEMADLEAVFDTDIDDPLSDLDDSSMDDWLNAAVEADSIEDESLDSVDFAELMDESDDEVDVETPIAEPVASIEEKKEVVIEKKEVVIEKKEEETAVISPKAAKRQKTADQLNYAIYVLMAVAILIVLYMAYLLLG